MKKGLIITLYDNNNYGNRLQNFALQNILSKYINVETYYNIYKDKETSKIRRTYVMKCKLKIKIRVISADKQTRRIDFENLEIGDRSKLPDLGN